MTWEDPSVNNPPSEQLAVFGSAILEGINETTLPRIPRTLQRVMWSAGTIVDHVLVEADLHDSEMFDLLQSAENVARYRSVFLQNVKSGNRNC